MKPGEKIKLVLEVLEQGACGAFDILEAMALPRTGFGSLPKEMSREVKRLGRETEKRFYERKERQRLYNLISKLKREGLVRSRQAGEWTITRKGKERLRSLKNYFLPRYTATKSNQLKIVMFDVPERYKRYRDWIRSVLLRCGFQPLQKSVFAGQVTIPEEFIQELSRRSLLHYVQIFSVGERGTLENYINTYIERKAERI